MKTTDESLFLNDGFSKRMYHALLKSHFEVLAIHNRILILSGCLRGISLTFHVDNSCIISSNSFNVCVDLHKDLSLQNLFRLLLKHNVILLYDILYINSKPIGE